MGANRGFSTRHVVVAAIAVVLLVAMVRATSGGLSTQPPTPTVSTLPTAPAVGVQGAVTVRARHLLGHTWQFVYTVRNTGAIPIAGFQINAAASNLYAITGRLAWTFFGSGICHGSHQAILVYWSTSTNGNVIQPQGSATFGFKVNTTGLSEGQYFLSWGTAQFATGQVQVPAPSELPASGSCS